MKIGNFFIKHRKLRMVLPTGLEEGDVVDLNYDSDGNRTTDTPFMQAVVMGTKTHRKREPLEAIGNNVVISFMRPRPHFESGVWHVGAEVWDEPHPLDSQVRYRVIGHIYDQGGTQDEN